MYDWESAPLVKVGFSRLSFYFSVYLDVIYYCFWFQLVLTWLYMLLYSPYFIDLPFILKIYIDESLLISMFLKNRVQTYHKNSYTFCLFLFICQYIHKLHIKIIPSCHPLMKTEQFPDKKSNSTLKYLRIGRQNHFLQSAILPVSKAYSIVAQHLLKCQTNIEQYIYHTNKSNIKIFG